MFRDLITSACISALLISSAPRAAVAFVEPATAAAAISAASFLLNTTRPRYDVDGAMQQAQLTAILHVHNRLNNIENGVNAIIDRMDLLAQQLKLEIERGFDKDAADQLFAAMDTIGQIIESGATAESSTLSNARVGLIQERNTVLRKNDFNLRAMLSAFVYEATLCQSMICPEWKAAKAAYHRRFRSMLDPSRTNSLAAIYYQGQQVLPDLEKEIMKVVSGMDVELTSGRHQWFALTRGKRERVKIVVVDCPPHGPISYDAPYSAGNEILWDAVHVCDDVVSYETQNRPDYTSYFLREITVTPVKGAPFDAKNIELDVIQEKKDGAPSPKSTLYMSDSDFSLAKERMTIEGSQVSGLVSRYNAETARLLQISAAMNIVSLALSLSLPESNQIDVALVKLMSGLDLRDSRLDLEAEAFRRRADLIKASLDLSKKEAQSAIDKSLTDLSEQIAKASADSWRSDALTVLEGVSVAIRLSSAIANEITNRRLEAAAAATEKLIDEGGAVVIDSSQETVNGAPPSAETETPSEPNLVERLTPSEALSLLKSGEMPATQILAMNAADRTDLVRQILSHVQSEITLDEKKSFLWAGLSILDTMTSADMKILDDQEFDRSVNDAARFAFGEIINSPFPGPWGIAASIADGVLSSTPTATWEYELIEERNIYRSQFNALLWGLINEEYLDNQFVPPPSVLVDDSSPCLTGPCIRASD